MDPTGGAGLIADVRAIRHAGAWACAACACLTVQSTRGVQSVHPVATELLAAQVQELARDVDLRVIKVGALGSSANLRWLMSFADQQPEIPIILDPVMQPSVVQQPGATLFGTDDLEPLEQLLPALALITPNLPEAEAILREKIPDLAHAKQAAAALVDRGAQAVLLKGGHDVAFSDSSSWVVDWLATRRAVVALRHRRLDVPAIHGTGCVLSSLIAGRLATGPRRATFSEEQLVDIIRWARRRLTNMMSRAQRIGSGLAVLAHRKGVKGR